MSIIRTLAVTILIVHLGFANTGCDIGKQAAAENAQAKDTATKSGPPNIVFIMADDLGYGDLESYNSESKIPTPNLDALARSGMRFTDAHAPAASCTPTRYGIITGRNPWRGSWKKGNSTSWKDPSLIESDIPTLPKSLREAGYHTVHVGKWHLGGNTLDESGLPGGMTIAGYVEYIVPDGPPAKDKVENYRTMDGRITRASIKWLEKYVQTSDTQQPFYLQIWLSSPHDPWLVEKEWEGKSIIGSYGDEVMQMDAHVGQIAHAVEKSGLADNTLVVFASDNGPEASRRDYTKPPYNISNDIEDRIHITDRLKKFGHDSTGGFRDFKASPYEGGQRVPFIASWKNVIPANTVANQLLSLTDLYATFVSIAGANMPNNGAEDSINQAPVFFDPDTAPQRVDGIFTGVNSKFWTVRKGSWTLVNTRRGKELYNLADDPAQRNNLIDINQQKAEELESNRLKIVQFGKTGPANP